VVTSGDDRSSIDGAGPDWALIRGLGSALIDTRATRALLLDYAARFGGRKFRVLPPLCIAWPRPMRRKRAPYCSDVLVWRQSWSPIGRSGQEETDGV
jgi:hypothetical protein